MDQKQLFVLVCGIAILAGCATSKPFAVSEVYEINLTPSGKTTNFQPVEVDIPAGDVSNSVIDWARQTDMDVLFSPDDVQAICSRSLKGLFDPVDALRQLLEGTGLTFSEPVIGAFVVIPSQAERAQIQPGDSWKGDGHAIDAASPSGIDE